MTKQEFEDLIGKKVTIDEYNLIELVYTFHPSISEIDGKQQIALLYNTFGMRVIRDMEGTARKAQVLEEAIITKRNELDRLMSELNELKR